MIYNLDSCIVIEFLRSNENVKNKLCEAILAGDKLVICSVVYYEVMRGFDQTKPPTRRRIKFDQLYSETEHITLDDETASIAAEIYRYLCKRGQKIEDDDIFIAAITLANDATLITDNVKHFGCVPNLKVINWKDL
ncbi:MAG: PIN domain-containing protein [Selenomonadaceae bacterium]|nr:PIN domain-containing protein [Selenomonadaceae bacterium]